MSFLPSSPTLMNQAPLIADFTLSGPIVGPYRRGSDSSGQTLRGEGGREGVGSISSKKTCQQNKILTNDRKDREIPPPFPIQTPAQPALLGRWRHHLSRLAFVQCRLRKSRAVHRGAASTLPSVCQSGCPQLTSTEEPRPRASLSARAPHSCCSCPAALCRLTLAVMWAVLTLSLDLPHTRPGGAPSLRQLRLPPAGGASLRVFLIGLTGRQPRRSAVWRSKHRNCAEKKKIKRGNQMSSDCAYREEERETPGTTRALCARATPPTSSAAAPVVPSKSFRYGIRSFLRKLRSPRLWEKLQKTAEDLQGSRHCTQEVRVLDSVGPCSSFKRRFWYLESRISEQDPILQKKLIFRMVNVFKIALLSSKCESLIRQKSVCKNLLK